MVIRILLKRSSHFLAGEQNNVNSRVWDFFFLSPSRYLLFNIHCLLSNGCESMKEVTFGSGISASLLESIQC